MTIRNHPLYQIGTALFLCSALFFNLQLVYSKDAVVSESSFGSTTESVQGKNQNKVRTFRGKGVEKINYIDENGKAETISTTIEDTSIGSDLTDRLSGYTKKADKNQFQIFLKDTANEEGLISYRYDLSTDKSGTTENLSLAPHSLSWVNDKKEHIKNLSDTKSVKTSTKDNAAVFKKIFGNGIDLNYEIGSSQLKEELILQSKDVLGEKANEASYLSFSSYFTIDESIDIYVNGVVWDKKTAVEATRRVEFKKGDSSLFFWEMPRYWDTTGKNNGDIGKLFLEKKESSGAIAFLNKVNPLHKDTYIVSILVPSSYLYSSNTEYPVIIDPTFTDSTSRTIDANANWLNTNYKYRKQLTITNNSGSTLNSDTIVPAKQNVRLCN